MEVIQGYALESVVLRYYRPAPDLPIYASPEGALLPSPSGKSPLSSTDSCLLGPESVPVRTLITGFPPRAPLGPRLHVTQSSASLCTDSRCVFHVRSCPEVRGPVVCPRGGPEAAAVCVCFAASRHPAPVSVTCFTTAEGKGHSTP